MKIRGRPLGDDDLEVDVDVFLNLLYCLDHHSVAQVDFHDDLETSRVVRCRNEVLYETPEVKGLVAGEMNRDQLHLWWSPRRGT